MWCIISADFSTLSEGDIIMTGNGKAFVVRRIINAGSAEVESTFSFVALFLWLGIELAKFIHFIKEKICDLMTKFQR